MSIYLFKNEATGEIKEVVQRMEDEHTYKEGNIEYKRVFVNPQVSIDSRIQNPFDINEYVSKTARKVGTYGEVLEHSAELSEKRKAIAGEDPIKAQAYKHYEDTHHGMKHPEVKKKEANAHLERLGFKITD